MFPTIRPSLLLPAALVMLAYGRTAAAPSPVKTVTEEKVAVVTVIAESGVPFREFTAKDFVVKEDGKKRTVLDVQLSKDPLSVALILDTSQPAPGATAPTRDLRTAAGAFVKAIQGVNPDARIALWQFASTAAVTVDFTNKADDLQTAIERLYPNQQTSGVLLEAVHAVSKQLAGRPGPRRAMVTVDFNSSEGSSDAMLQQAADSLTNSGGTLWAVSVRVTNLPNANREEFLDRMTKASGGKRFTSVQPSGLELMLKKVAASLTSQYIVTFERPDGARVKSTTFETVGGPKVLPTPFMR